MHQIIMFLCCCALLRKLIVPNSGFSISSEFVCVSEWGKRRNHNFFWLKNNFKFRDICCFVFYFSHFSSVHPITQRWCRNIEEFWVQSHKCVRNVSKLTKKKNKYRQNTKFALCYKVLWTCRKNKRNRNKKSRKCARGRAVIIRWYLMSTRSNLLTSHGLFSLV